ncbi:MAG: hypothetical protein V4808_16460, partial [Pseudomonadota bacterium]
DEFRMQVQNHAPIVSGRIRTEEEVYEEAKGGPGQDIYTKGAWVLHTLRNLIGDAKFFDVTRLLVYGRVDPRPGNFQPRFASTPEYIGFVNQVTGKGKSPTTDQTQASWVQLWSAMFCNVNVQRGSIAKK